ncbi:hypothetical protein AUC61_14625 [Pseudomonas sp. S25]|uniref:Minor tail protein n=1 Tax=Pseudomonas maioricensis TaxID=1766623 RepID=A0ABS9ZJL2_9PSED|nr:hypothetical protein [Pseudomonas sp. S25]MCI8210770.1 hypothetical protein [Pseudomonas sp. S25]
MSIQPINIGQTANDGNGESLRDGGLKINANFADLDQRALDAAALIAAKVDKVDGLGLSETSFTQGEKTKLAGLESPHFRGTFATLAALVVGVAAPVPGDYADVDTAGADAVRYIWDSTDSVWLAGGSSDAITAAQVKSLYESNPDTNPFTDVEKAKVGAIATTTDGLAEGATNKYWTSARTLGAALAGLVLDSATVIAATDTVLTGLGKLQAQISAHVGKRGAAQHPVSNITDPGFMPAFPSVTDGKTYGFKNGVFVEVSASSVNNNVFGEMRQLSSRNSVVPGVAFGDGQLIGNALAQYPQVVANLQSSTPTVAVTTPALWLSDPAQRACWAYDSVNDQIRVPDLNGKSAGSIGPAMFRPDGTLGFAPGAIRRDQIQNITGSFTPALDTGTLRSAANGGIVSGAFKRGATRGSTNSVGQLAGSSDVDFDASGSVRTGTETFPTHFVGVWGVVLFGAVVNAGTADAGALATSYANQQASITALQVSDAGKRNKLVKSAEQTVASGGFIVWAHGLGVVPETIEASYVCKVAEYGYGVGDTIKCSTRLFASSTEYGMQYSADATNVTVFMPDVLSILQKGTRGGGVVMTPASWRIVIKVEKP